MPKSFGRLGVITGEFAWVVSSFGPENDQFWAENEKIVVEKGGLETILNTFWIGFSPKVVIF